MEWRSLFLCLFHLLVLGVSSERIVSRTGLMLGEKKVLELDGKEISYLNEFVINKIGEVAPYLLVEDGTFQQSNLVDAYYHLYKYAADGATTLTYQTRVKDERGYPQLVTKEAIFGVHFHLTFQVPPPPSSAKSPAHDSDESDKSSNESTNSDAEQSTNSKDGEKKENENKNENNDENEKREEKEEKEENREENNIAGGESITTELSIFQDIRGLLSISSCISYKTKTNNNENSKEEENTKPATDDNNNEDSNNNEEKSDGKLKILSYNIWNYNSPWKIRHKMIADEVAKILPDIIAWQEVRYSHWDKMDREKQTKEHRWGGGKFQVEQLGTALLENGLKYHFVYHPAMVYIHNLPDYEIEGLSFFSKYPILESNFASLSRDLNNGRDEHQRICARALIETPHGKVNVFVTHMSLDEDAQERNAQEILKFADQYEYPQILMGDFNCLPDTVAIEFLTGAREIDGVTGNFVDAWSDYTSRLESVCDESGVCNLPCSRTTHNATCWETDGYTFNALDEMPRKRIDFILVRGAGVDDVTFVGNTPFVNSDGSRVMASDHFGMFTNLRVGSNNNKPSP